MTRIECPLLEDDPRMFNWKNVQELSLHKVIPDDECWDCMPDSEKAYHVIAHVDDGKNYIVFHGGEIESAQRFIKIWEEL